MSIALDSPMEALAIHGVLTAVNNVWPWIAFLTAAISFWKIKSSIHIPPPHLSLQLPSPPSPPLPQTFPVAAQPDQPELPSTTTRTVSSTSTSTFCTLENRKSGKFSVYYAQDDKTNADKIDSDEEINLSSIRRCREEGERLVDSIECNGDEQVRTTSPVRRNRGEDGWEVVMKMKTTDMGWYLYQDLTVLDGNVVRLWN